MLVCGTNLERECLKVTLKLPQFVYRTKRNQILHSPVRSQTSACPPTLISSFFYPSPSGCSVLELPLTQNLPRSCETDQAHCHGSLYIRQEYFFWISDNTDYFLEVHLKGYLNASALCRHGNCIVSSPHKNPLT